MSHARLAPWFLVPALAFFGFLALPAGRVTASPAPEKAPPAALAAGAPAPEPASAASDANAAEEGAGAQPAAAAAEAGEAAEVLAAAEPPKAAPVQPAAAPTAPAATALALGEMTYDPATDRYVAKAGRGKAVLTLRPRLQQGLTHLLDEYRPPAGAVVLMDPRTGRVLAMAEHQEAPGAGHVALTPMAPAASIFKIVTSAALLEHGVGPNQEVCFHGGKHRIQKALLSDNPRRDRRCLTLSEALGKSANVVFAKMAGRELSPEALRAEARRFRFNAPIPFAWPVTPSPARIPDDPFELATTAAGFGPVRMSPLHGALIASVVASGGKFVAPQVVESIDGERLPVQGGEQVLRPEVAAALTRMMETTTTEGTARKFFRRDRLSRSSPLREIAVAGKTGSLAEKDPFRDYSWFVGFAPANNPQVAVAAVMANGKLWHARASQVAHEALKAYFAGEARGVATARR